MSAEIVSDTGGIITARITGKLTQPELVALQDAAAGIIRQRGNARLLVIVEEFQGWEKGGDWGDLWFQANCDPFIEKIAIVGDQQWADLALLFVGKGVRCVPIEYFQPADLPKAKAWLAGTAAQRKP